VTHEIKPHYWFVSYHIRKVATEGAHERFCNEAIAIHPMDWVYQLNRDNVEYYTLIFAMPIDEDRYNLAQKDHMKKGTTSLKRPKNIKPTW